MAEMKARADVCYARGFRLGVASGFIKAPLNLADHGPWRKRALALVDRSL